MKNILKIIAFISLVLIWASCVTQKKCNAKFPPSSNTQVHDSIVIKDSIVYRDRIVPFKIAGDTVWQDKPIPGIPEKINTSPMYLEDTYAKAIKEHEGKIKIYEKHLNEEVSGDDNRWRTVSEDLIPKGLHPKGMDGCLSFIIENPLPSASEPTKELKKK